MRSLTWKTKIWPQNVFTRRFGKYSFQKARTKIEVVLTLPCWLSQLSLKNPVTPNVHDLISHNLLSTLPLNVIVLKFNWQDVRQSTIDNHVKTSTYQTSVKLLLICFKKKPLDTRTKYITKKIETKRITITKEQNK